VLFEQVRIVADDERVVPLPSRSRRDLVALHPALATRYVELVAAVAPAVEISLDRSVCANRVAYSSVAPPILRLAPWRAERLAFAARLEWFARRSPCLVFTDVRECYRSIRPEVVERSLVALGADPARSADVGKFLRRLEGLGVTGVPVGPDPSAVLANAVLRTVDEALIAEGYASVRWVDDVVVAAAPSSAGEAASIVGSALASVGLRQNEAKTRVMLGPDGARATVSCGSRPTPVG
jgi:hypothetical protein